MEISGFIDGAKNDKRRENSHDQWICPLGPFRVTARAPSLSSATGEGRRAWPSCHPRCEAYLGFCRFLPWGYDGLNGLEWKYHDIPRYNGLPKWRYHGDIMEISWGYNGLNGLVEKLLEFLFSGNSLDLTIGGSGHKSRGLSQSWNWSKETFQQETSRETSGISRETHRENFL